MRRSILALALAGSAQAFSFTPTTHAPALRTSAPAISSKGAHMAGCACTSCRALHTLHLGRCKSVVDVSDLGRCESLRVLNLRCSGATVVPRRDGLHVEFDVPTWVASPF